MTSLLRPWLTAGLGVVAGVCLGGSLRFLPWGASPAPPTAETDPPIPVLVHLFEWRWTDVAQECETFLGPLGVTAVQVSPPQEHVVLPEAGYPWWQRYQPVSYQLESRGGSRADFAAMVSRCRQAGVAIYADAVINHMAGVPGGTGSHGTPFTQYAYPGLYSDRDFHPCRQPITDYGNADNVTQCELVGLADLDTASPYVQQQLVAYLADLHGLGVAGFRIDAAKHIRAADLGQILSALQAQLPTPAFIYQEVIDPGTEAIRKQDYYPHGAVVEFEYGRRVGMAMLGEAGHSLAALAALATDGTLVPSDQAIVFIDNHDKQRGHGGGGTYLTYKDGPRYTLANVFMLAYPYGQVRLMSSYHFHNSDQGPPAAADGTTQPIYDQGEPVGCAAGWVCEHRHPAMAAMVRFRQAVAAAPLTHWWDDGHQRIAFGRGDQGFVILNNTHQPFTHTFTTALPPGDYCNLLGDACPPLTVDDQGQLTVTVPALGAVAVHRGAVP